SDSEQQHGADHSEHAHNNPNCRKYGTCFDELFAFKVSLGVANVLLRFGPQNQGDDGGQEAEAREQGEDTKPQGRGGQAFGLGPHVEVVVAGVVSGGPAGRLGEPGELLGDLVLPPGGASTPIADRFGIVPVIDVVVVLVVPTTPVVVGAVPFPAPSAVVVLV